MQFSQHKQFSTSQLFFIRASVYAGVYAFSLMKTMEDGVRLPVMNGEDDVVRSWSLVLVLKGMSCRKEVKTEEAA
jgi:hypothetical protein